MHDIVIVSDYAGGILGKKIAAKIGCQYVHTSIESFPDGEADIRVTESIRGRTAHYVCPFYPNPMRRKSEIDFVNSTLKYSSAASVVDVSTYLGFMKKDWKDKPRVPISIREIAVSMEQYAQRVITMDMHSHQIELGFRIPLDHLDGTKLIAEDIKDRFDLENLTIASPDIGRAKWARRVAERSGVRNIAIVYKLRDPVTLEVVAEGVFGDIDGKDVVFVDDQAVTLGTLTAGANAVRERGARSVCAYVSHGVMAPKNGTTAEQKLADSLLTNLYMTDSIPREDAYYKGNPKIMPISCVDLFAEAIIRNHTGRSLSELFA